MSSTHPAGLVGDGRAALRGRWRKIDKVVLASLVLLVGLAVIDLAQARVSLLFALQALAKILPFLLASVLVAAGARATGLDRQVARVFTGRPLPVIAAAALFGALSPFCSCGVIPLIAALLKAGVPVAPVMAFWIASPLMSPEMYGLTAGVLGAGFATAKTAAALAMGLSAGLLTHAVLVGRPGLEVLRPGVGGSGCAARGRVSDAPIVWRFWRDGDRRATFVTEGRGTALFLLKWMTLAFLLESLMVTYVPADLIGTWLGADAWWAVPLSALIGMPTYLNGYAAIPTVKALIEMGMGTGAAMSFMLAGGVSSIPAAMAVFALVRRELFFAYLLMGLGGAMLAGLAVQLSGWPG